MRWKIFAAGLLSIGLATTISLAQQAGPPETRLESSRRHHEWVEIEAVGGRKVKAFVVYPESDKPATAVIIIHENKGLTDWERSVADQLAEVGYIALAPDLLSGMAPGGGDTAEFASRDAATQGIYRLPQPQVTADLDAVFNYAQKIPAGNKVVAVGGFCWGGGQTFNYAAHNPNVAAGFVFYGVGPAAESQYASIKAPVYGFYGENDARITGQVPQVEQRMKQAGKKYEPVIYDGAGHGFMRQGDLATDANNADRKARDQAWERLKKILAELKPSA